MPLDVRICFDSHSVASASASEFVILWNSCEAKESDEILSLPRFVEENAEFLKESYLCWLYELGRLEVEGVSVIERLKIWQDFSFWWMTLLNEKCNFDKSPQIDDAIKLIAFVDWAKDKGVKQLFFDSHHCTLSKCLSAWCRENRIHYKSHVKINSVIFSKVKHLVKLFIFPFKAVSWLVINDIKRRKLKGVGIRKWYKTTAKKMFVGYSDGLLKKDLDSGLYNSPYWGSLPKVLKDNKTASNWLHVYVPDKTLPAASDAAKAIKNLNNCNEGAQCHVCLDSFRSLKVFTKTIADWIKLNVNCIGLASRMKEVSCQGIKIWPLFEYDWVKSTLGSPAISSISFIKLFESAFKGIPQQDMAVYLCEFIDWEYAFGHAFRSNGNGHLIGYSHSTIRFWDLRYFFDNRCYQGKESIPLPDKLAVVGDAAKTELLDSGFHNDKIIDVEALRYMHLSNDLKAKEFRDKNEKQFFRILICGDYSSKNNEHILTIVEDAIGGLSDVIVVIKPHPNCPIEYDDFTFPKVEITMAPLQSILAEIDLVIVAPVTSAVLDAYFSGVQTVVILDEFKLNLSPARNLHGVTFIRRPNDLKKLLASFTFDYQYMGDAGNYFNLSPNLPLWRNLVGVN